MRRFIAILALVAVLAAGSAAAEKKRFLQADYATFKYDSTQTYWEFYYSVYRKGVTYQKSEQGDFSSQIIMRLALNRGDSLWAQKAWKFVDTVADTHAANMDAVMVDHFYLLVPAGSYSGILTAQDLNNPALIDTVLWDEQIDLYGSRGPALSEIELASTINQAGPEESSPFVKNRLVVIPNPSQLFDEKADQLFFYVESYNMYSAFPDPFYRIRYYISDLKGVPVAGSLPVDLKRKASGDRRIEFGALGIGSMLSGSYLLNFDLLDTSHTVLAHREKQFYLYKPQPVFAGGAALDQDQLFLTSDFAVMDEKQIEQVFEYSSYLLLKEQRDAFRDLGDLNARRRYLFALWRERDTSPETPVNEYYLAYMERVRFANKNYSRPKREGWHTDRGRILLLFGPPTSVDSYPNELEVKPYEIWNYDDLEGGVIFVFGDLFGINDLQLLHSTKRGEIRDENYLQKLGKKADSDLFR